MISVLFGGVMLLLPYFTIFYLLQYLPTFIQNDPNCNVQGDLKLQYTQHDFQQAPRQVVAQMGLKMVPEIGTQT